MRRDGQKIKEQQNLKKMLMEKAEFFKVQLIEKIEESCHLDLVISCGGDGTYLDAAHVALDLGVPVAGINIGHLGFLVEIDPEEDIVINSLFQGTFLVKTRLMLSVEVKRKDTVVFSQIALNEVAIQRNINTPMLCLGIKYNDEELPKYRGDGVLVATPTGSTAYNLSFNGPILYPSENALVINAMAPHALTYRPIVVPAEGHIVIEMKECGKGVLNCDGRNSCKIMENDLVTIRKSSKSLQYIPNPERTFFDILSRKLHLGKRM